MPQPEGRWPAEPAVTWLPEPDRRLRADPDVAQTAGPSAPQCTDTPPDAVWLTAESLGNADPVLAAHPTLPALFIFDAPLLQQLRLSAKRLVFITEYLAELAETRQVEVHLGMALRVLEGRRPHHFVQRMASMIDRGPSHALDGNGRSQQRMQWAVTRSGSLRRSVTHAPTQQALGQTWQARRRAADRGSAGRHR